MIWLKLSALTAALAAALYAAYRIGHYAGWTMAHDQRDAAIKLAERHSAMRCARATQPEAVEAADDWPEWIEG